MGQYRCRFFTIKELVNPALLARIGEETAWRIFDPRLLKLADDIRRKYGPCTVNANGLVDCGLRDPLSATGAKYSMHKIGRALDLHIRSIELEFAGNRVGKAKAYNRVREELLILPQFDALSFESNSKEYPGGIHWLHCDTGNRDKRLYTA